MTSEDRLAQIRARAATATPGPWWVFDHTHDIGFEIAVGEPEADGHPAEKLPEGFKYDIGRREDAEFIAGARQDVPFLLDLLDELEQLTTRDVHPEADLLQHDDAASALHIAGMHAALNEVRRRILNATRPDDAPSPAHFNPEEAHRRARVHAAAFHDSAVAALPLQMRVKVAQQTVHVLTDPAQPIHVDTPADVVVDAIVRRTGAPAGAVKAAVQAAVVALFEEQP